MQSMDYIFNQLKEGKIGKNAYLHIKYIRACEKSEEDNGGKEGKRARKAATVCYGRLGATNRRERARSASTHLAYI